MATIAVVIASHNDAELLAICLAAPTRQADRILVLDNASTDGTAPVCAAARGVPEPEGLSQCRGRVGPRP
ncbi:glycosyltransferase family 2 protein [Arthrobacter sp. LAPM80]|uniref:glycosyltransferase family 2 protein n=1 Tax=Arthrobacter sp. LAPM80 TaxID=3141788 RepID=UPI00398B4019